MNHQKRLTPILVGVAGLAVLGALGLPVLAYAPLLILLLCPLMMLFMMLFMARGHGGGANHEHGHPRREDDRP